MALRRDTLPRTGGTMETKVYTLWVDHLEQEILLSIRLMPRIDSGSRGEIHEEAQTTANQTHRFRQMMPPLGVVRRRLASSGGTAHTSASLITVGTSGAREWREPFASVQDGSPLGLEEVADSNLVVARAGLAAAAQNISCAASSQRQGDYDGVAIAGSGPGMEHLKKRYDYGTDDGKGDHRPAGATRARAGRRRPRSKKCLDEWPTFLR